ncbi:MAG: hypothetical protein A3F90_09740 [Deltaproteobacteria bacterium RIFCSPLOWO2_12_FULL_60_19]|nr:MAG: hypothetical protein A3F90_09740 [Deltaproteobacteria bacterium RIFCSPLOWO2_12_FULL_60_19]
MDLKEIREWAQFAFLIVGGTLGLVAFFQNLRQRRLENALKLVSSFRDSLREGDLAHWEELFHASSEPTGAKPGHYVAEHGGQHSISEYFSEGSGDGYAISRMAQNLEIICHEICEMTVDARIVWFELGQLLNTMHEWLSHIPGHSGKASLLESAFPSMARAFEKHGKKFHRWPTRPYAYIE